MYYLIDDGNGNGLTTGLQTLKEARRIAQSMADARDETVYIYRSDRDADEWQRAVGPIDQSSGD